MSTFAEDLIRKHNKRFERGMQLVGNRRAQWSKLVARASAIMENVAEEAKSKNLFEHLYVLDSTTKSELSNKLPTLQLFFGQHPLGYDEFSSNKLVVESGCTLTVSQLVSGQVVCTLYPFCSQLQTRREKYIIACIVSSPDKLGDRRLRRLVSCLMSYAQVSSVYGSPSITDWVCVYWLKAEHWWLHFRIGGTAINLLDKLAGVAVDKAGA